VQTNRRRHITLALCVVFHVARGLGGRDVHCPHREEW
jgi:hypothetical protein